MTATTGAGKARGTSLGEKVGRLKILHLAFEDHRRPGSGGGSARNQAINARLGAHHDITVVTTRYRGARARVEDGVTYRHLGLGLGYWSSLLSYFALLPWYVWRHGREHDLVVEEFAAPLSSMSVARWTSRPTMAVVQWLNARGKSRQYRMPFFLLEDAGVRSHRHFVAMSADLASELRRRNPDGLVEVVPNGVDADLFEAPPSTGTDIVFLGRLEIEQKGLDLLLDSFALIADRVEGDLVVAGDGADRAALERQADRLRLGHRVRFVGRVAGRTKRDLLAGARVVAMPSRYETFGMVAVEARACGTPVVAFDIPCLREVVSPAVGGLLVDEQSASALAEGLLRAYRDDGLAATARTTGRDDARAFDWDRVAADQERIYRHRVGIGVGA